MGLDVTAYSKLKKIDAVFSAHGEAINPETREPYEDVFQPFISSDFLSQAEGISHMAVYEYHEAKRFWAGGYGRYNGWREQLAKLAGYKPVMFESVQGYAPSARPSHQVGAFEYDSGPFKELICFSDCDGVIGPQVAMKLARDFADWDERAKEAGDEWFYEKYREWRECFEMASDNGAVSFH